MVGVPSTSAVWAGPSVRVTRPKASNWYSVARFAPPEAGSVQPAGGTSCIAAAVAASMSSIVREPAGERIVLARRDSAQLVHRPAEIAAVVEPLLRSARARAVLAGRHGGEGGGLLLDLERARVPGVGVLGGVRPGAVLVRINRLAGGGVDRHVADRAGVVRGGGQQDRAALSAGRQPGSVLAVGHGRLAPVALHAAGRVFVDARRGRSVVGGDLEEAARVAQVGRVAAGEVDQIGQVFVVVNAAGEHEGRGLGCRDQSSIGVVAVVGERVALGGRIVEVGEDRLASEVGEHRVGAAVQPGLDRLAVPGVGGGCWCSS